jgi:hypothetical protein
MNPGKNPKQGTSLQQGLASLLLMLALFSIQAFAQDPAGEDTIGAGAISSGVVHPGQVYWGDTHVHSSYSFDAYPFGNESVDPGQAFRFARGEEVISAGTGQPAKLSRPLDWLVVADHAEYLGMTKALFEGNESLLADPNGARIHELVQAGQIIEGVMLIGNSIAEKNELFADPAIKSEIWQRAAGIADAHNDPGQFTAFIGFEWTSMPGTGDNLHRVVVYRDAADAAASRLPFSVFDSEDPEDLWAWMASYEQASGGDVLAIPHNGNTSNGLMFSSQTLAGRPLTRTYAEQRARWEPLYEVTQIKGDGETHPFLSPDDAFADFETWDRGNITANTPKESWMLEFEYARSALRLGLEHQQRLGANPFLFGLIGSTDSHTGLATADDANFWGKMATLEPGPERIGVRMYGGKAFDVPNSMTTASGYTGVWATANTREALFSAMRRKEVYATTGPRIIVRFFGGWSYTDTDAEGPGLANTGYAKGVPMGGYLPPRDGAAPAFLVSALMDPDGASLDRVQIVKGWLDGSGKSREKVYNVAWSDDRHPGAEGYLPPVGNTVDVANATWTNTIGAGQLNTVWTDPDFDPAEPAFYYARVIEIPTPRWTTYDAARFDVPLPDDIPWSIQQRAYTSPIWYQP